MHNQIKAGKDGDFTRNVNCGRHTASSCSGCPQGNGKGWCNGECNWNEISSACVKKGKRISRNNGKILCLLIYLIV